MTDRSRRPPNRTAAPASERGWRAIGPDEIERRLEVDDPEVCKAFLPLLESIARLTGLPPETRVRGGAVIAEQGAVEHPSDEEPRLRLTLRLTVDPDPRSG